jgi:hypothetical protein
MSILDNLFRTPDFSPVPNADEANKARIDRRRKAAMAMILKAQQGNNQQGQMIGGGGGGDIFGPRPGIYVPGNTGLSALGEAAAGYLGGRENEKLDAAETQMEADKYKQHEAWLARQPGEGDVGGNSANTTPVPPTDNSISNNLLMLMGDEGKAAAEAADNEAAMLGASPLTKGEQRSLSAYTHPTLTATAPSEVIPPAMPAAPTPPKGMSDQEQLRWLLEGQLIGAPGAATLLNQAGGQLMTGEAKREAAMEVIQVRGQQAMELAAARAEAAMANARTRAEQEAVKREWQSEQNSIYKNTAAEIARHNRVMENRPVGGSAAGGKPLSPAQEKAATGVASTRDSLAGLAASFKDSYSGNLLQSAEGAVGEVLGGSAPRSTQNQTRWWSDFRQFYELPQRHELFGAALTPQEAASWKASSITPSVDPAVVRQRLATLQKIQEDVIARMRESARASGKSVDQFDALTRPSAGQKASAGPVQVRSKAEAMALPPGTRFIDPNGVERVRP